MKLIKTFTDLKKFINTDLKFDEALGAEVFNPKDCEVAIRYTVKTYNIPEYELEKEVKAKENIINLEEKIINEKPQEPKKLWRKLRKQPLKIKQPKNLQVQRKLRNPQK